MRLIFLLIIILNLSCFSNQQNENTIRVAASSNMQFAVREIADNFEDFYETKCEVILGSSGQLTSQILNGAPYDVFLSADLGFGQKIFDNNKAKSKPKIYAQGELVLWTTKSGITPSVDILDTDSIKRIGIANPDLAPYGKASLDYLKQLPFYEKIKSKLVFGENISQVNQFQMTKAVDICFTAKGIVKSPKLKTEGRWVALETVEPLSHYVVRVESRNHKAKLFYDFLFKLETQQVLKKYGYNVSKNQ